MAQVKIEGVVYHLDGEFKKALAGTMLHFAPQAKHNMDALFQYFLKRVANTVAFGKKCRMTAFGPKKSQLVSVLSSG